MNAPDRRIRLKELAGELELSITTVSRALAGYSDVAAATRERVQAAAERHGYVPSRVGRMLVSGRTDFIGMVLPVQRDRLVDAFVGAFVAGLGEGLTGRGRDLFIATVTGSQTEREVMRHVVDSRRADALVLNRTEIDDPRIRFLLDRGFPFVSHGRAPAETRPYVWFDTDGAAAFAEAVDLLTGLGHEHFALIRPVEPLAFAEYRRQGMVEALAARGLRLAPEDEVRVALSDEVAAREAAARLLSRKPRPTAMLCATDSIALAVLETAQRLSIAVPDELSVIGFDNVAVSTYAPPPLSTFDQRAQCSAATVAEMVVDVLENGTAENRLVRADFIPRASHGPAPRRSGRR